MQNMENSTLANDSNLIESNIFNKNLSVEDILVITLKDNESTIVNYDEKTDSHNTISYCMNNVVRANSLENHNEFNEDNTFMPHKLEKYMFEEYSKQQ